MTHRFKVGDLVMRTHHPTHFSPHPIWEEVGLGPHKVTYIEGSDIQVDGTRDLVWQPNFFAPYVEEVNLEDFL